MYYMEINENSEIIFWRSVGLTTDALSKIIKSQTKNPVGEKRINLESFV